MNPMNLNPDYYRPMNSPRVHPLLPPPTTQVGALAQAIFCISYAEDDASHTAYVALADQLAVGLTQAEINWAMAKAEEAANICEGQ